MQKLKPADNSHRRRYVEWLLEQQAVDGNFSSKIYFSDEAHSLGMLINKITVQIMSQIMSTFKLYNKNRNIMIKKYFICVLFVLTFETAK